MTALLHREGRHSPVELSVLFCDDSVMQALNRALHPGAKADYSLVFTGSQGVGKDRVLEAMFAPYIGEACPLARTSK